MAALGPLVAKHQVIAPERARIQQWYTGRPLRRSRGRPSRPGGAGEQQRARRHSIADEPLDRVRLKARHAPYVRLDERPGVLCRQRGGAGAPVL